MNEWNQWSLSAAIPYSSLSSGFKTLSLWKVTLMSPYETSWHLIMTTQSKKKGTLNGVLGDGETLSSRGKGRRENKRLDPWRLSEAMEDPRQGPIWRKWSLPYLPAGKLLSSDAPQGAWLTGTVFRGNITYGWAPWSTLQGSVIT